MKTPLSNAQPLSSTSIRGKGYEVQNWLLSATAWHILAGLQGDTSTFARSDRRQPSRGIRCKSRSNWDSRRESLPPAPEYTSTRTVAPGSLHSATPEALSSDVNRLVPL